MKILFKFQICAYCRIRHLIGFCFVFIYLWQMKLQSILYNWMLFRKKNVTQILKLKSKDQSTKAQTKLIFYKILFFRIKIFTIEYVLNKELQFYLYWNTQNTTKGINIFNRLHCILNIIFLFFHFCRKEL